MKADNQDGKRPIARLIAVAAAVIPLLYIPGLGVPFREIKLLAFWLLGIACMSFIWRRLGRAGGLRVLTTDVVFLAYLMIAACSISYAQNFGIALSRAATLASAFAICMAARNCEVSLRQIAAAVCVPVTITGAIILSALYGGPTGSFFGGPLGGLIGERNTSAVFLAAAIPLMLLLTNQTPLSGSKRLLLHLIIFIGLTAAIVPRTRTAWWMIIFELCIAATLLLRARSQGGRPVFRTLALVLMVSIVTIAVIPQHRHWNSKTPYLDSISTIASLSHSSGRNHLWRVGFEMVSRAPWLGTGLGNFPVVMQRYLETSDIAPRTFAFLDNNPPLFNDYLQSFVENGIPGGALFTLVFGVTPLVLLFRGLFSRSYLPPEEVLAATSCGVLSVAALLNPVFLRAETLLLFSVTLGCLTRTGGFHYPAQWRGRLLSRGAAGAATVAIAAVFLCYGGSLSLRRWTSPERDIRLQQVAWLLWPWDSNWHPSKARSLYSAGFRDDALQYVEGMKAYWPDDSRRWFAEAELEQARGNVTLATQMAREALIRIPAKACGVRSIEFYREFAAYPSLPEELRADRLNLLSDCIAARRAASDASR